MKTRWCHYSGEAYSGDDLRRLRRTEDSDGRVVCPGCGKAVKLRRHPSSGAMFMQVPRHRKALSQ